MHILPLLSRSYSDFAMVFCHCNATFLQIISSLSSLARSFCHITKPISVRLQQTENKSVCNFVVPFRKPCRNKTPFCENKTPFQYDKTAFRRNETPFCKHLVLKRVQKDWIARSESAAFFLPLQGKRIVACGRLETTTA